MGTNAYAPSAASAAANLQALSRAIAQSGVYVNRVNRERAAYLSGRIDVTEFERRVGALLGIRDD